MEVAPLCMSGATYLIARTRRPMAGRIPSTAPAVVTILLVAFVGAQFAPRAAAQDAEPCIASTIKGYNIAVQLGSNFLHWMTPNSTTLNLLLESTSPGWAAVGWSADGRMAGSDAVVGNTANPTTVQAYTLSSTFLGGQNPTTSFELGNTSVTANGDSTYIKFSRTEGTGDVPVKLSGASAIIYASSPDGSNTLFYHGPLRGSAVVDFSCKFFSHPAVALAPIQPYPLPHYRPSPSTLPSPLPYLPAVASPSSPPSPLLLPAVASPPPRRRLSSSPPSSPLLLPAVASPPPRRRLSLTSPPSPLPPPRRRLSLLPAIASPPPRRRLSSSPPSPLLLPVAFSPPPRRRLSLFPAVASPLPPRRRLSLLPAVASPSSPPSPLLLPAIASPPPRRRLSSSPPSPLLLPAVASPPPRRRLSLPPAVASPSSPPSPLPPPWRRLWRHVHERKRELVREGGSVRELGWVRERCLVRVRGLVPARVVF
ncbi:unnamed protein product [Closterium sp. Naga37s-1]|nr:unnamed protein product [Closterium sp. Naga37s-1]